MDTLIICEHNWRFVKLRNVAQIVRKFNSYSAFYHVSRDHYQFFTDSLNAYY